MANVKVRVEFTSTGRIDVLLAGVPIASGASCSVPPGKHQLSWTVTGKGSSYSVKVTAPPTAMYERSVKQTTNEFTIGTKILKVRA